MPVRNGVDPGAVGCLGPDVEHHVTHTIRQRLDESGLEARATFADRAVGTSRIAAFGALSRHHFLERAGRFLRCLHTINEQDTIAHLNCVAWQADQALDIVPPRYRMSEHHHVAALRGAAEQARVVAVKNPADILGIHVQTDTRNDQAGTGRIGIPIREFVHEQKVTDQKGFLHRARGNPERLEQQRAEHPGNQQCIDDRLDCLDKGVALFLFLGGHLALLALVRA